MTPLKRKLLITGGIVLVGLGAFSAWVYHGNPSELSIEATTGLKPELVEPDKEYIPSFSLAKTIGWQAGEAPVAAKGLQVARFAEGLNHPRTMLALPNGDVLVAETGAPKKEDTGGITGFFQKIGKSIVGAGKPSADQIVLLRDANGDGVAEAKFVFRKTGMESPSGLAYANDRLFIANHNAVWAFDFKPGATELTGTGTKLMDLPAGGSHWMRNLVITPEGDKLYVAVGSASNIGENGMDLETGRAMIWEIDLKTKQRRPWAAGMRNPNGMGFNPSTGELWTVVNERDQLGPDLVPDYLTNVPVGAQYGWPWVYWKDIQDKRVEAPMPQFLTEYSRKPEYALGAHTAPLGLLFAAGGHELGETYSNGAFIARHGSWNRKPMVGYDVVFLKFDERGNPVGMPEPVLTGFLTKQGGGDARGRPTWLAWDNFGGLLVSDDTAGIIWRVIAPDAKPSVKPEAVASKPLPPVTELKGDPSQQF